MSAHGSHFDPSDKALLKSKQHTHSANVSKAYFLSAPQTKFSWQKKI